MDLAEIDSWDGARKEEDGRFISPRQEVGVLTKAEAEAEEAHVMAWEYSKLSDIRNEPWKPYFFVCNI